MSLKERLAQQAADKAGQGDVPIGNKVAAPKVLSLKERLAAAKHTSADKMIAPIKAAQAELCVDEGCPQAGTDHVCVSLKDEVLGLAKAGTMLEVPMLSDTVPSKDQVKAVQEQLEPMPQQNETFTMRMARIKREQEAKVPSLNAQMLSTDPDVDELLADVAEGEMDRDELDTKIAKLTLDLTTERIITKELKEKLQTQTELNESYKSQLVEQDAQLSKLEERFAANNIK